MTLLHHYISYTLQRRNLGIKGKKLFNMPLSDRIKEAAAGKTLLIKRAEMVFQQQDKDENNQLNTK